MPRRLRSELFGYCLAALLLPLSAAAQPSAAIAGVLGELRWGMRLSEAQRKVPGGLSAVTQSPGCLREEPASGSDAVWRSRDGLSQTFHVYRGGKLAKLYIVYEPLAFPEGSFMAFTAMLQRRLGPGTWHRGAQTPFIEWRDRSTRVRALDQTNTYGAYCLMLTPR